MGSVFAALSLVLITIYLVWRFEDTIPGAAPFVLCALGLALYPLAFFNRMSWMIGILAALGLGALGALAVRTRRLGGKALGTELKRQFLDAQLWIAAALILAMCLLLRGERILEWDGYNFWGPDTKSLYYRDGFAPRYANAAPKFGNYPPMLQLLMAFFARLLGGYRESYLFMTYYAFGALLLFSMAARFRAAGRLRGTAAAALACVCAVVLPGVACTAWYRALYVDSIMAMLFGTALSLVVCRDERHPGFWRAKLLLALSCLTLVKSIGFLWALLALLFYAVWRREERGERRYVRLGLGCVAVLYGSWALFCRVMARTTALESSFPGMAARRLQELLEGRFFSAGDNWGYLTSYARAILLTPVHREWTPALDLTPAALIALLFLGAFLLWKYGFVPKEKGKRLFSYMAVVLVLIYAIVLIGQFTMFYTERQYLQPVNAVTLLTRYAAPAHMGLLILLAAFASGQGAGERDGVPGSRRRTVCWAVATALILSCGAYAEMGRRFLFDPLDGSRVEKRAAYCAQYADCLEAVRAVPLDEAGGRVIVGIYDMDMNPIVFNEASPVSVVPLTFSGDTAADRAAVETALKTYHANYLFLEACPPGLLDALSDWTDGKPARTGVLYRAGQDGGLRLRELG